MHTRMPGKAQDVLPGIYEGFQGWLRQTPLWARCQRTSSYIFSYHTGPSAASGVEEEVFCLDCSSLPRIGM